MLRVMIGKELRQTVLSGTFVWVFVVASMLILLTFYLGGRRFQTAQARYEAATAQSLRQMEGLTTWLEARPSIFVRPLPVASLVQGLANDVGRRTEVRGTGPLRAEDSLYGEDPVLATFRFLDLEFIFQVVLSLLAVVLAFDAVSGEKERGTLRQVLSNAVPRHTFILGKMIGTSLALTVPLLLPLLLGCLLLIVMAVPMTGADWLRLALVTAAGLLYLGLFVGAAVWVSALTRRAVTSMVVMLVVWLLVVIALPRAALLFAARAIEVPTVDKMLSQRTRLRAQLWGEQQQEMNDLMQEAAAGGAHGTSFVARLNQMLEERSQQRQARLDELETRLAEERRNRQALQQRLGFSLARLSPAASFSLAATAIAGTDLSLPDRFMEQARAYQKSFEAFQRSKTGGRASGEVTIMLQAISSDGDGPQPIDPHELPPFVFQPPDLASAVATALPDLGVLALFNLLTFAGAFVAFMRYDVR